MTPICGAYIASYVCQKFTLNGPFLQHNFKKLRNNIEKSKPGGKRRLKINGKDVTWGQFTDAFEFDQNFSSLKIHERLTEEHFNLDSCTKMRNHLAEDVLNKKMLFLMQVKFL